MNLIPFIAEKLGVEIGEEFKIKDYKGLRFESYYKFDSDRLRTSDDRKKWTTSELLLGIVNGSVVIEKLPFEPTEGETYWFVKFTDDLEPRPDKLTWHGYTVDYLNKYCGNCFRTEEETEREKYNVFEKLTGKKWMP